MVVVYLMLGVIRRGSSVVPASNSGSVSAESKSCMTGVGEKSQDLLATLSNCYVDMPSFSLSLN